ncbi:MAG: hypothetical protein ACOYNY_26295 [Caldilineaceae bacterium]
MSELVDSEIKRYKQWMIGATKPRTQLLSLAAFAENSTKRYNLKGSAIRKYLQHEEQTLGINLGWTDDGSNETGDRVSRWFFARNGDGDLPIKYGEKIAIGYGKSPSFIHYEKRTIGINLDWANNPVFEWKLLGGKIGAPVHTQEWLAIYNEKSKECLIYFDRSAGGDIGWPSSQTWGDVLEDLAETITKEAWEQAKKAAVTALLAG